MTKAMKYVLGSLAAVIVLAIVLVIGISIGIAVTVASKNTNSTVLVSQQSPITNQPAPGFSPTLKNDLLGWTFTCYCEREDIGKVESWKLSNEYTKENLQGDLVYFLEYEYYLTPLKPATADPNDPPTQQQLDEANKEIVEINKTYKDPKTITLMITKRGHKWFILGIYPPPEKDLRMIDGNLVDRNEWVKKPYPTRNE